MACVVIYSVCFAGMPFLTYAQVARPAEDAQTSAQVARGSVESQNFLQGSWRRFGSADILSEPPVPGMANAVIALAEGERYVYALTATHSMRVLNEYKTYDPAVLVCDKFADTPVFVPLVEMLPGQTSGHIVDIMEYDPKHGVLVMVYRDMSIDILHDGTGFGSDAGAGNTGSQSTPAQELRSAPESSAPRILKVSALAQHEFRGEPVINSVTLSADGTECWVALSNGFIKIDLASGKCGRFTETDAPLVLAAGMGSRILLCTSDGWYATDAAAPSGLKSNWERLTGDKNNAPQLLLSGSNIVAPQAVVPLSDNALLYIGGKAVPGNDAISCNLAVLPPKGSGASVRVINLCNNLLDMQPMGISGGYFHKYQFYGIWSRSRDGVTVNGTDNFKSITPDASDLEDAYTAEASAIVTKWVKEKRKDVSTQPETATGKLQHRRHASYDGATYWQFMPREGFICRTTDGEGVWQEKLRAGVNSCPTLGVESIEYNPAYGMMVRCYGDNDVHGYNPSQCDGLSAYSNGAWTVHSLSKTNRDNATLVPQQHGIGIDPMAPNFIYGHNYNKYGILRQDLENPKSLLNFTRSNYNSTASAKVAICDPCKWWKDFMHTTDVKFDRNGVMWFAFSRLEEEDWMDISESDGELWYWTPEERAQVTAPGDYAAHPMQVIKTGTVRSHLHSRLSVGQHERNANRIMVTAGNWNAGGYQSYLYDHNGTLADRSDDRMVLLDSLVDEHLEYIPNTKIYRLADDPYDGRIIISNVYGLLTADPEELLAGNLRAEWLRPEGLEGEGFPHNRLGVGAVSVIAADPVARKWFGTDGDGVYVLSADRSRVLAHFTKENSGLPDNRILSIAWNPEEGSMWIGTEEGVGVYYVPGAEAGVSYGEPAVYPGEVAPSYPGYVTFSGLADGVAYNLLDCEGNIVAECNPEGGIWQWHPHGVAAGTYILEGAAVKLKVIIL